ncbi:MAG: hypothetical protein ISR61_11070 [Desulfobacteraceae bacterium]|nr:hypothetical protein [Desulfobacteraceae bacterium]
MILMLRPCGVLTGHVERACPITGGGRAEAISREHEKAVYKWKCDGWFLSRCGSIP